MIFVRVFIGAIQFATLDRKKAFDTNEPDRQLRDGVMIFCYDNHGYLCEEWRFVDGEWYHP
jgi:hypothetical protein